MRLSPAGCGISTAGFFQMRRTGGGINLFERQSDPRRQERMVFLGTKLRGRCRAASKAGFSNGFQISTGNAQAGGHVNIQPLHVRAAAGDDDLRDRAAGLRGRAGRQDRVRRVGEL